MPEVTLADCDREPIHIPGAVQPHGVLLASRQDQPLTLVHVKLLIVEDETDSRDLLALVLRGAGAEVHPMSNGVEALELLRYERFDAIVSDIGLPAMDGMELLRSLRAHGDKRHQPPAIALTAYTRAYDRTRRCARVSKRTYRNRSTLRN